MELKEEVGFIISRRDYLLYLEGLPSARINDVIISEKGGRALVSSLEGDKIQALMLEHQELKPGDLFKLDSKGIRIPLGNYLMGRTLNSIGFPIDGKQALPLDGPRLELEVRARGVRSRLAITEQLFTGSTLVDVLIPIGKGQRELLIGEARSGKSSFLLDMILNQKNGVVCIYTAIGKPELEVKRFVNDIYSQGAQNYTIIVAATSSSPTPQIMIAPDTAFSIAEFFCREGRDVLLILDDLGVHAKYLREISLLSRLIPGRESYPGSIFYQHSHLMERAGRFKEAGGASTITLLPVIETGLTDITGLIPTNLMSQTDGHILFSEALHAKGQYPAIDWSASVTRVGRQTQKPVQKLVSTYIRKLLARYKELELFSKFDTELGLETRTIIRQAGMILKLLKQEPHEFIDPNTQIILLSLAFIPSIIEKGTPFIVRNRSKIIEGIEARPDLLELAGSLENNFDSFLEKIKTKVEFVERM